ncbi:uncharacterized protein [Hemitrygon akajei]|uniref:uncharacterized protein n=1 Tax=Hemitrygon akajei TaxID=2704970 RepID=UPI003BF96C19
MPLGLRHKQLEANYWINLRGHGDSHPTRRVLETHWDKERTQKESFGWTGEQTAKDMGVYDKEFCPSVVWPVRPFWVLENPSVDLELLKIKCGNKTADIISEYYRYKECKYKDLQIFTDGSKDPETGATGPAIVVPSYQVEISKRTPDCLSVYAVEMFATLSALEWSEQVDCSNFVICSDSVSALASIKAGTARGHQDLLFELLFANSRLARQGKNIAFTWVPAYSGIMGNETADKLAKAAVRKGSVEVDIKLSKSEGKSILWRRINQQWQQHWDRAIKGRHLHSIQNRVDMGRSRGVKRKEQVVISRLRIGHSNLNGNLAIINKHPTGFCDLCQETNSRAYPYFMQEICTGKTTNATTITQNRTGREQC